jgi:hypothetical protein
MINVDDFCVLELKNGIVHANYATDVIIDLDTAKAIVAKRRTMAKNLPHKVLVTGGPINISKDARKFALSEDSNALISSWAIVTEENLLKLTFFKLLFFTQNRKHKMRFFKDEASGLAWLENQETSIEPSFLSKS